MNHIFLLLKWIGMYLQISAYVLTIITIHVFQYVLSLSLITSAVTQIIFVSAALLPLTLNYSDSKV